MCKISEKARDEKELGWTEQVEREIRAADLYLRACEESGVNFAAWQSFAAWREYVDGKIGEGQLDDRAKADVSDLMKAFGKYVVLDTKVEGKHSREEEEKKKRARKANEIYRQVCRDVGAKLFFFEDFASWSDFVEGKLDEAEFYNRAKLELKAILSKADQLHPEDN